jgi:small subunit ribosomal protein S17
MSNDVTSPGAAAPATTSSDRGRRRTEIGVVTSDKMNKTRRVEIPRLVKHATYGKYVRRRTVCHVHDENNESKAGDTVEIVESRPYSKSKHWRLIRVVKRLATGEEAAAATTAAPPANNG